jgi:hypothetical protein
MDRPQARVLEPKHRDGVAATADAVLDVVAAVRSEQPLAG